MVKFSCETQQFSSRYALLPLSTLLANFQGVRYFGECTDIFSMIKAFMKYVLCFEYFLVIVFLTIFIYFFLSQYELNLNSITN